jgi:signal transduction histidine kinase/ligand-binding sensor domain-containing protein/DNA-binding response OmpR family regulator
MVFEMLILRMSSLFNGALCGLLLIVSSGLLADVNAQPKHASFVPISPGILSSSDVRCFHKDSKGYMWFGTADGLIRYDGVNAYRYMHSPDDNTTIAHSTINIIVESKDKKLWIGTAQGLCIYDRELDNFINVDSIAGNNNYLSNRYITDIEFDANGHLWIGTHEGGINIYDPVKREFNYIIDPAQKGILPSANFISKLVFHNDVIWCATKGGLLLYDADTRKRLPLNSLEYYSDKQISDMVVDRIGNIWMAGVNGQITQVIPRNGYYSYREILSGEEFGNSSRVLTMCFDHHGNLLVGGENAGFSYVDVSARKVNRLTDEKNNSKRLPTNSIESIYVDNLGMIWIGTLNNGVFVLDVSQKNFEIREPGITQSFLQDIEARSFAEDAQGNIWIAYYGIGLGKIDSKTHALQNVHEINQKLSNKNVSSVICDRQGELWLGTLGKGVYRINTTTHQVVNYSIHSDGFGNDQVFCLYEDRNGVVWAGTWGSALFFFDAKKQKFVSITEYDQPHHIPNTAYITAMTEDSDGVLWVGTLYGLYELKRKGDHSFTYSLHVPDTTKGCISGALIQAIKEDKNKNLWVATGDNGLNLKKKENTKFILYRTDKGLISNTIRSLLTDRHGNIWMGGNMGLSKLEVATNTVINYAVEDGLKSNNFYTNASLMSSSGKFFFGSNNGFDCFFPDSIHTHSGKPTIYLSDLKINNQSVRPGKIDSPLSKHISLTSDIELSYDQRSFMIDFVALDYNHSTQYTYCYKLEGFDTDWNCIGTNHSATYTNIDPGHYVFLVKAANREGVWSESPLRLEITIDEVFWQTWWAISIYSLLATLAIYALMKFRIERLRIKNQLTFEKLAREQEHELSELKTQFFTNISHEFRTPLSLVLMPLESLMDTNEATGQLRERIFTAYKNANRMMRLVNELADFTKLEGGNVKLNVKHGDLLQFIIETSSAFDEMALKRKISFSVTSDLQSLTGWYDNDKLERILFNVLSNAFKFTADGGKINLQINSNHSILADGTLCRYLELVIVDNGIGISADEIPRIFEKFYQAKSSSKISSPGTGIGLSLTKSLVELHQGKITAESIPDHSTIFTISLPIDAIAFQVEENILAPNEMVYDKKDSYSGTIDLQYSHDEDHVDSGKVEILVAEDNDELREYLVTELRKEFSVLEARDGKEGLAIALEKNPYLIISDIMMPNVDGIEFCNSIKADINTSHIPFILLTAKSTIDDQINGIKTGADVYITKPFNIRYLKAHLHQIIESRQKLYSRFSQDVYLMPSMIASNALDEAFLQKAIDYILKNLQDTQLSVDSVADLFNLSRMQVYRKIKGLTGKSVVEFIRMVRMKQAIKLMDTHKFTLSEIAFEVGFNSSSYFTRCFKEEYNKTPSEYLQES